NDAVGMAALARAKSRGARRAGGVEEDHSIAARPPARAGWPAVNAGGRHGVDERAIAAFCARAHQPPTHVVVIRVPPDPIRTVLDCHAIHARSIACAGGLQLSAPCDQILPGGRCLATRTAEASTKTFVDTAAPFAKYSDP